MLSKTGMTVLQRSFLDFRGGFSTASLRSCEEHWATTRKPCGTPIGRHGAACGTSGNVVSLDWCLDDTAGHLRQALVLSFVLTHMASSGIMATLPGA